MCFGAAESLSVKWQRPKQFQNNKLSMAMKNMVRRKPAAEIDNTYCDTVSECNMSYVACKWSDETVGNKVAAVKIRKESRDRSGDRNWM
jgi:hypothetical protein